MHIFVYACQMYWNGGECVMKKKNPENVCEPQIAQRERERVGGW